MTLRALFSLGLLVGCGSTSKRLPDGDGDSDTDSDSDSDACVDSRADTAPLFEPDHVVEVEIEMAPADWDALRTETRTLEDTLIGRDCLDDPFGSPFTWFPATVTVDGQTVENVGVRKKGFLGSLSFDKPSLKIGIDQYVTGQKLLAEDDFVLNNSQQDSSYVHQCLAYATFDAAGVPSPRCNFAHVVVNGEDLGAYVHVERVDKDFLCGRFESNDGNLYEGTLSDFRDGWLGTFEPKTNEAAGDTSDLDAVVAALDVPDAALEASLDPVLDVEAFLTFWATEVLVAHGDGYAGNTNNFFAYDDPGSGRFHLLPWGADSTFIPGPPDGVDSVMAQGVLAWRLYRYGPTRDRYVARMREILDGAWNEDALLSEIDRMEALVSPLVAAGETPVFQAGLAGVRDFVAGRRAAIEGELDSPPPWDAPLRDSFCFVEVGTASGTFDTSFGTLDQDPFASGTGTLDVTIDGVPWAPTAIGSQADYDPDQPGRSAVNLLAPLPDGSVGVVALRVAQDAWTPGGPLPFDFTTAVGFVGLYVPVPESFTIVGLLFDGSVTLDEASTGDGDPVSGRFDGTVVEWPF